MNRFISLLTFVLSTALVSSAVAGETEDLLEQAQRGDKNAMELYYSSIAGGKLDFEKAWKVGPKTLDVAWATLKIDGGWMVPVVPSEIEEKDAAGKEIPERPIASAVYVGEGSFDYSAPHETERWLMNYSLHEINKKYTDLDGLSFPLAGGATMLFQGKWLGLLQEGSESGTVDKKTRKAAEKLWKKRGDLFQGGIAHAQTWDEFAGNEEDAITLDLPTKEIIVTEWWVSK